MSYLWGATGYCWACLDGRGARWAYCAECGAPPWTDRQGPSGVYIIQAPCGLNKIGWSRKNVYARIATLSGRRRNFITRALLLGANAQVEHWLHGVFAETRDKATAYAEGLPCPTEWFWPSPSIDRLAAGLEFIRDGVLWEEANFYDYPEVAA